MDTWQVLVSQQKSGVATGGPIDRRRRRWSEAPKRQIVAESHEPGISESVAARRYNVDANQVLVRSWLRRPERHRLLAGEAELGAVAPHPVKHHADPPGQGEGSALPAAQHRQA